MATMNINLGAPFEDIMDSIINRGYAGNRTEVIRQALLRYEKELQEDEDKLVFKAIQEQMARNKAEGRKRRALNDVLKAQDEKRGSR